MELPKGKLRKNLSNSIKAVASLAKARKKPQKRINNKNEQDYLIGTVNNCQHIKTLTLTR